MGSPISSPVSIRCQAILFDMDGILISSIGSVERSWAKWAKMRGVDPALAIRTAHGCRAIETAAKLRPDLDSAAELKVIEEIEIADTEDIVVLPGVPELLAVLPEGRWAVVTSATARLARVRLAAGGVATPRHMVAADQITRGKPHPDPYLAGAALLRVDAKDCVVFEDAASGVAAGRAAGCTVIATPFSHSPASLADADYLVAGLTQVRAEAGNDGIVLHLSPAA
jgi:sugar-phosphatase